MIMRYFFVIISPVLSAAPVFAGSRVISWDDLLSSEDITIFDPETVRDNADFTKGKQSLPSTGIPYVIVNGTVVVKDSKVLKDVYPGQRSAMQCSTENH